MAKAGECNRKPRLLSLLWDSKYEIIIGDETNVL